MFCASVRRSCLVIATACCGLAHFDGVRGATRSWDDGGPDKSWHTAANWSGDALPLGGDDVIIGNLLAAAGDEITLAAFVNIGSLEMFNETTLRTGSFELLVNGGPLDLLSTLDGATLVAEDRDPGQPARTTLLDSVDADSLRIDNDCVLQLDDGVVEVDTGELYVAPNGYILGAGRIDLARTDAGRNLNNNGLVINSVPFSELLIQSDSEAAGANGTVDLDGNTGVGRWWASQGDITIMAPLSDTEFNGVMLPHNGEHITIHDDWQLGDDGEILFEMGGVVTGGDLKVFGTALIESTVNGSAQFRDMHMQITGGTPEFRVEAPAILDIGYGGTVTYAAPGARFHGDGTLRPGMVNIVDADTQIGDDGTNELSIDLDQGAWTLNADLLLDVASIDPSGDGFDDTIRINNGALLNLDLPGDFLLQEALIFNGGTVDNILAPHVEMDVNEIATIRVESGLARILMPVRFLDDTSTVYVAPGATLDIDATTFRGGTIHGEGVLQAGTATIEAPTTISVATLDMDHGSWRVHDDLTLDVDAVSTVVGDGVDGLIEIDSATFDVNVAGGVFKMQGTFDLRSAIIDSTLNATRVTFDTLTEINALSGVSRFNTPVEFLDQFGQIDIDVPSVLIFAEGATFRGGGVGGGGILRVFEDAYVEAPTVISVTTIDFDGADWYVNADLTLNVSAIDNPDNRYNGHVVVSNATLTVNTAWEAGAAARIELDGGTLAGFGLVLDDADAYLTGHGAVTSTVVNDGLIRAEGGVLQLQGGGSNWDGTTGAGRLNAYGGDLHLVNALPFVFRGDAAAFDGHELFVDGAPLHFDTGSLLWLSEGKFRSGATYNYLDGQLLVSGPGLAKIEAQLFRFDGHAQVTLGDDLLLSNARTEIVSGAAFTGGGTLINNKASELALLDGANVQVAIENHGVMQLGASPGQALGLDFQQGTSGELQIELGGTSLNDFDRLTLNGAAQLAGQLTVSLWAGFNPAIGQVFPILTATGGRLGTFDATVLPAMDPGELMLVTYGAHDVTLRIVELLDADFDEDGGVDAADLARWDANYGIAAGAAHNQGDANGDGAVDGSDLLRWQQQNGMAVIVPPAVSVPEPHTLLLAIVAALILAVMHGRLRLRRRAAR